MSVEPTPEVAAASEALRSLILASQHFRQRFADAAGINVIDALALSHLASGGALPMGDLAARVGLAPSGATGLVDRLEKAGFADRENGPADNRRTVLVAVSDRGSAALALGEAWAERAILDLGEHRLAEVTEVLHDLAATLRRRSDEFDGVTPPPPLAADLLA